MAEENKIYKPSSALVQFDSGRKQLEKNITAEKSQILKDKPVWVNDRVGLGEGGMDDLNSYDIARGTAILTDIAGIAGSAILGAGNIGAAATGTVSTGLDLYADSEDGLDAADWGNAVLNLGLDVATLIPAAGTAAKSLKVVRGLKRALPLVQKMLIGASVIHGIGAGATVLDKIQKRGFDSLTTDDYANIARSFQAMLAGGRAIKSSVADARAFNKTKPERQKRSLEESIQTSLKTKQAKVKEKLRGEGKSEDDIISILNTKKLSDSHITDNSKKFTNKFIQGAKNTGNYVKDIGTREYTLNQKVRTPETQGEKFTNWAVRDVERRRSNMGILSPRILEGQRQKVGFKGPDITTTRSNVTKALGPAVAKPKSAKQTKSTTKPQVTQPAIPLKGREIKVYDYLYMNNKQRKELLKGNHKLSDNVKFLLGIGKKEGGKLMQKFEGGGPLTSKDFLPYSSRSLALAPQDPQGYSKNLRLQKAYSPFNVQQLQNLSIPNRNLIYLGKTDGVTQLEDATTGTRMSLDQYRRGEASQQAQDDTQRFLRSREESIQQPSLGQFEVDNSLTSIQPGRLVPKIPFRPITGPDNIISIEKYLDGHVDSKTREDLENNISSLGAGYNVRGVQLDNEGNVYYYLYEDKNGDLVGTGALENREQNQLKKSGLISREKANAGLQQLGRKQELEYSKGQEDLSAVPVLSKSSSLEGLTSRSIEQKSKNLNELGTFKSGLGSPPGLDDLLGEEKSLKINDIVRPNDLIQLGLLAAASKPVKADYEEAPLPTLAPTTVRGLSPSVKQAAERAKGEIRSMKLDTSDPSQRRQFLLQKADKISDITKEISNLEQGTIEQSRAKAQETDFRNRQLTNQALQQRSQARNQRSLADAQQKAQGRSVLLQGLGQISASVQQRVTQKKEMNKMYRLLGAKRTLDMMKEENQLSYDKALFNGQTDPNYSSKLKLLSKQRGDINTRMQELFKKGLS